MGSRIGWLRGIAEGVVRLLHHPVVVGLELGWRDAVARAVEPPSIPPVDPLGGGDLHLLGRPPGTAAADELGLVKVLYKPMTLFASALSKLSPFDPTDAKAPISARRSVYRMARYCTPRMLSVCQAVDDGLSKA
jgi:hypothetical protein